MTPSRNEQGFSLVEAVTATVIAVLAVLGLAYTFSLGRAQVDRYEVARAALGVAENRMERLLLLAERTPSIDSVMVDYTSPSFPFTYAGSTVGTLWWHVDRYDDPNVPGTTDLRRFVVCVRWNPSMPDSVQIDQLKTLP